MKDNLKVVHVVEGFVGGGVVRLVEMLVADRGNGNGNVFCVIYSDRGLYEEALKIVNGMKRDNVDFFYWKYAKRNISLWFDVLAFFELLGKLYRLKKEHRVDVVHLHSSKAGFLGRVACFFLGLKVVYNPHGLAFLMAKGRLKKWLYIFFEKVGYFFGGVVCAVSESEKKVLKQYGMVSEVIFNGMEVLDGGVVGERRLRDGVCVVNVGRIVDQKNPRLFNDIARCFEGDLGVKFIWVGDGDLRDELTCGNIEVMGWVDMEKVFEVLRLSDIYLSVSKYEGFSFSILEGMAFGLPLVLRRCVGNVDMVDEIERNGFVFDNVGEAVDYLKLLVGDVEKRLKMGERSRFLVVDKFSQRRTLERYREVYGVLVN